jgi:hypothetical protein
VALVRPLRRGPEPEIEGRAAPGRPADEFRDPSERAPGPQRVEQRIGDAAVEGRRSLRSLGDGRTLDLGGILLDQFLWLLIELPRDERCEDGGLRAEELNRCTQLFEQFGVAVEAREARALDHLDVRVGGRLYLQGEAGEQLVYVGVALFEVSEPPLRVREKRVRAAAHKERLLVVSGGAFEQELAIRLLALLQVKIFVVFPQQGRVTDGQGGTAEGCGRPEVRAHRDLHAFQIVLVHSE